MLTLIDTPTMPARNGASPPVPPPAIQVQNLSKTYGGTKVVDGISLAVLRGEIFGILGPNGAGKSTTLEMIEGLREPDANAATVIRVDDLDVANARQRAELRQRIGLQLQAGSLFTELTVRENLELLAMLYRRARPIPALLQEFDLQEKANARLDALSSGQRQRVALAAALVNDPVIVLLDEPTTALDPQARRNVWDSVRALQQAGKTIVLTTHYMEEAETLCDRVAIMEAGRIAALGTPAQLIAQYAHEQTITLRQDEQRGAGFTAAELRALPGITNVMPIPDGFIVRTTDLAGALAAIPPLAARRQAHLAELSTRPPSLEDVFLTLTGKQLRD